MTLKPPTPQGVSALLERAGFERGVSRPEELAADGYAVIPNRPDDGIVLVNWWGADAERGGMLRCYTEAIEAGGYRVRRQGDDSYLIVTAKEADR